MPKPTTILYAIGLGDKAVPLSLWQRNRKGVLIHETPAHAQERLQRNEDRRAKREGRTPQTVFVWSPQKDDVVDMPLLRSVGRRFGVGH